MSDIKSKIGQVVRVGLHHSRLRECKLLSATDDGDDIVVERIGGNGDTFRLIGLQPPSAQAGDGVYWECET